MYGSRNPTPIGTPDPGELQRRGQGGLGLPGGPPALGQQTLPPTGQERLRHPGWGQAGAAHTHLVARGCRLAWARRHRGKAYGRLREMLLRERRVGWGRNGAHRQARLQRARMTTLTSYPKAPTPLALRGCRAQQAQASWGLDHRPVQPGGPWDAGATGTRSCLKGQADSPRQAAGRSPARAGCRAGRGRR